MNSYPCKECGGRGEVEEITWRRFGQGGLEPVGEDVPCPECDGTGKTYEEPDYD